MNRHLVHASHKDLPFGSLRRDNKNHQTPAYLLGSRWRGARKRHVVR